MFDLATFDLGVKIIIIIESYGELTQHHSSDHCDVIVLYTPLVVSGFSKVSCGSHMTPHHHYKRLTGGNYSFRSLSSGAFAVCSICSLDPLA